MRNIFTKITGKSCKILTLLVLVMLLSGKHMVNAQISVSDNIPQYLFNRFAEGIVVKKGGDKIVTPLNYNIVTEEMIFIDDGRYLALGNLSSIDTVYLNDMIFIPSQDAFYELAVIGKIKLLVQFLGTVRVEGEDIGYGITSKTSRVTTLETLTNSGVIYDMDLPDNLEVSRKITYYIEKDGERERFINERAFLRIFRDRKKELKKYIDEEDIDFDNYNDVVSLVKYMNNKM